MTLESLLWSGLGVLVFIVVLFVLSALLPGKLHRGFPQADGASKDYKINGMALWVLLHGVVGACIAFGVSLAPLVTHFWSILVAANVVAVLWTAALFVSGRRKAKSGVLADWWYGPELNPTLLGVDLKFFAYQPSLLGLQLFNVAFAFAQWETLGHLTPQMWAYQGFWWLYFTTHYWHEAGMLSMWDIIAERFGFMLVWGDLVAVPFLYCIPGWIIANTAEPMAWPLLGGVIALHVLGLWIFRGANAQKNAFKRDRNVKIWGRPAETLEGRILVSGFWGIGRKLNYTGEICVYLSFALCAGFASPLPYLLPAWLVGLLVHRAWRDEKRCREKYGALWQAYSQRARFRMVPFIY